MNRSVALTVTTWLAVAPSCLLAQAAVTVGGTDFLYAWDLTLSPAREPEPALQYSLGIRHGERRYGDATPHYYRAALMLSGLPVELKQQYEERSSKIWLAEELSDATRQEMRTWLQAHQNVWEELETAAYCDRLDLDLRLRDLRGLAAISFQLPEAQSMRDLARRLDIKLRLEIAEGRIDQAVESLRVGFRLAEAAAKTPTVVNDLVGVSIASIMTHDLIRLIALPGSPNMYWAIATLPRPIIDQRESLEFESGTMWQIYPYLQDAETANRTAEEWRKLVMQSFRELHELSGDYPGKPQPLTETEAKDRMEKVYAVAKRSLREDGMPADRVEAMPAGQAIAIYTARAYRRIYDEILKCTLLPPADVLAQWSQSEGRLRTKRFLNPQGWNEDALPTASILLPAMPQAWYAPVRLERQLAALRVIEALRMHVAEHGKFPSSLNDFQIVAVPMDPLFGKPFEYRQEGDVFVLETLPRPGMSRNGDGYRYVLRLKK